MSEWIRVEDKEPPKDALILVLNDYGISIAHFGMGDWHEYHQTGEIAYEIEFNKWMPLPEKPNE